MTYTDVIALIGCITGCFGLAINLCRVITERFRLKILFFESDGWIIDPLDLPYKTNQHCIVHIEFINKSNHPICIYSIDAFVDGKRIKPERYKEDEIRILQYYENTFPNRKYYLSIPMDRQIELPIRLQPHDTYAGIFFYPYFPDCNESEAIKFIFKTTKHNVIRHHTVHRIKASEHDFDC